MITSVFVGTRCGVLLQKMSGLGKNPSFSVSFRYNLYLVHSNLYNSCYGRYHFIRCSGQFARDRGCWYVSQPLLSFRPLLTRFLPVQNQPSLWVHVDAAWAGMSFACPEYREIGYLESINRFAHSFCTNFHKVCQTCLP